MNAGLELLVYFPSARIRGYVLSPAIEDFFLTFIHLLIYVLFLETASYVARMVLNSSYI